MAFWDNAVRRQGLWCNRIILSSGKANVSGMFIGPVLQREVINVAVPVFDTVTPLLFMHPTTVGGKRLLSRAVLNEPRIIHAKGKTTMSAPMTMMA